MNLRSQKKIAARILKCGMSRIWIDPARVGDVSEAITAADINRLIKDGVIKAMPKKGISNFRKKKLMLQKKKGRRKGIGSRKGSFRTRLPRKKAWMKTIRAIRMQLHGLKAAGKIDNKTFRDMYQKSKSGMFRSRAHLMFHL